ncbi:hypothetical protein KP729_000157|uniref:hypothetical protein n=1 Tax=Delftia acidovorans TaxID=80866 RepID=UPI001C0DCE04|nr:hypothetical protein [Delftia acidovorans]MCA1066823.1 hypothetical protein [Delftia acidovorans]
MVTVYLDSSDYSTLSDPKRETPELSDVLQKLIAYKDSKKVKFIMTDVLVGEALPKKQSDIESSLRRVKLIKLLCGENVGISQSSLLKKEISQLIGTATDGDVITQGTAWIAGSEKIEEQVSKISIIPSPDGVVGPMKLRKIDKLHRDIASGIIPIHPNHKNVLIDAYKGIASKKDITNAFLETLNDLEWVVASYRNSERNVAAFRNLIREHGERIGNSSRKFVERLKKHNEYDTISEWRKRAEYVALELALMAITEFRMSPHRTVSIEDMKTMCPGLYFRTKAFFEYIWTYVGGNASKPISDSTYPDVMHITYAPYVDIFRPDRTMAHHVKTAMNDQNTVIVESLLNLPSEIDKIIATKYS